MSENYHFFTDVKLIGDIGIISQKASSQDVIYPLFFMISLGAFSLYLYMKKYGILFYFFLAGFLQLSAQSRFDLKDSIPVIVGGNQLANPWAGGINFPLMSEIDLNGDGLHDIFIYERDNNRILTFLNNGDTTIRAWSYAPQFARQFPPINKWAFLYDYNCDGKADLMTLSTVLPSGIAVYRNDYTIGSGLQWTLVDPFVEETFGSIITNIFASGVSLPAFCDMDNDGDMDILGYNSVPDGRIVYHQNLSMETYGNCDSLKFHYGSGCWGNFALLIGGTKSVGCFHCPCRTGAPGSDFGDGRLEPIVFDPTDIARRDDTISSIFPIDLDGDGDKELLVGDISSLNTLMVHNGGTAASAEMDTEDLNFPATDVPAFFNGFHFHAYIDLNNDGKKDLIVMPSEYENLNGLWWYRNSGTTANPTFHFQGASFLQDNMIDVGENASPVLFDYDNDGLLDMIIGASVYQSGTPSYKTSLYYFKNSGTPSSPAFELITNDAANISSLNYSSPLYPAFGDMDGDGDGDMILGTDDGKLQYFNNAGGAGNPSNFQLAVPNYMGIDVGGSSTPQIVDLDRDGKLDLVVGEKNGFINFYQNIGTIASAFFANLPTNDTLGCIVRQASGFPDGYTVPFVYDTSGKYRMMVSNMAGNVYLYSNIDNNLSGCFTLSDSLFRPAESNRIKYNLTVSGGDLNNDGFSDLIVGSATGGAMVFYMHDPFVSVQEIKNVRPSLEVFPNPASDYLHLKFYNVDVSEKPVVNVFDNLGRKILSLTITNQEMKFETSSWPSGIYLVQVTVNGNRVSRKIVVSR